MSRRILIKPTPVLSKRVFVVFDGRGDSAEYRGVYPNLSRAQAQADVIRENSFLLPHIETREVDRRELENLLEDNLTQAQFESWGRE